MSKKVNDLPENDVSDSYRIFDPHESSEEKRKKRKAKAKEKSKERRKDKERDGDNFTTSDLAVVRHPSKIEFHDKLVDKKLDEQREEKTRKAKKVKFEETKIESDDERKKEKREDRKKHKKSDEKPEEPKKLTGKSSLVIIIDSKDKHDKNKAKRKASEPNVKPKRTSESDTKPIRSTEPDGKLKRPSESDVKPTRSTESDSKPARKPDAKSDDVKPSVPESKVPKTPSDSKRTSDHKSPSDPKPPADKVKSTIPKLDSSKLPKDSKRSGDEPKEPMDSKKAGPAKAVTGEPKPPESSRPTSSDPKMSGDLKAASNDGPKTSDPKLGKSTSDEFPYQKNLLITSKVDLPDRTDSTKSVKPEQPSGKPAASKDALEQIKSKLEGHAKPDAGQSDKPPIVKAVPSPSKQEPRKSDERQRAPSPSVEIKQDKDRSEINIKSGQDMKANLSLGPEIRAQVEDRESKTKVDKESAAPAPTAPADGDDQESDWSSISIQLDITKDPKTKKIEISEDVKVLPTSPQGGKEAGKQLEHSVKKKVLPKEEKADEAKPALQPEPKQMPKKLEIVEPSKEPPKEEDLSTVISPKELDQALSQPTSLSHRPSITHYVKSDETGHIRLDSRPDTGSIFDRFYSPNNDQDAATRSAEPCRSDEAKSTQSLLPASLSDDARKPVVDVQQTAVDTQSETTTRSMRSENLEQQAVVLYKAETESEKSKDSGRSPKRMDLFGKKKSKKPYEDSSSDEQTYEEIINRRNETLRLHFPTLSISPPPYQPTPPPFHLKLESQKRSQDQINTKSEEMTYHEQKRRFSLNQVRYKEESKGSAKGSTRRSKSDAKLADKQNYENIKKLHIPSEKVAAEIEHDDKRRVQPAKKPIEILNGQKPVEVKIEKKRPDELKPEEVKNVAKPEASNAVKPDAKNVAKPDDRPAGRTNDEQSDDQSLISRFNNEQERLRRMERYLVKVKGALNSEQTSLEAKKSLVKRLILIKKDLNQLGKLCEQLLERDYLDSRRPSDKKRSGRMSPDRKRSPGKRRSRNKTSDDPHDKPGYSADSSLEDSGEMRRLKTLRKVQDEMNRKLFERDASRWRRAEDGYLPEASSAKDEDGKNRKEEEKKEDDKKEKDEKKEDEKKEKGNKKDEKTGKDGKEKDSKPNQPKEPSNETNRPTERRTAKIKRTLVRLSRGVLNSRVFRVLLFFIILATLLFSYCYYRRNLVPKRFPCRLKRKLPPQ